METAFFVIWGICRYVHPMNDNQNREIGRHIDDKMFTENLGYDKIEMIRER
jgi:hypothetical protein